MKSYAARRVIFVVLVLIGVVSWYAWLNKYVTFESIKENRAILHSIVENNYFTSVVVFIILVVTTGLFTPAAIPMILVGGFLFGVLWGTIYVSIGFIVGACLAFLLSRYLIGGWVQHKYGSELSAFNDEISRHGRNYLIILRLIPLFPFFTVNYLAGLTKMPLSRYAWSTLAGMIPISVAYSFAGREIGQIESPGEILSAKFLIVLFLLVFFALLPVLHYHSVASKDERKA